MAGSNGRDDLSRRTFIKAGAGAAAVVGLPLKVLADEKTKDEPKQHAPLPRRVLGRTGEKVTILNMGAGQAPSPRLLNAVYNAGIRFIDTAATYGGGESEKKLGEWMTKTGRRKELIIVTKDMPKTPDEWVTMLDKRLEALQTDYIDLFFLHAIGENEKRDAPYENTRDVPKSKEWAAAAEKMKKSGKCRFVGFSTHTEMPVRVALLNNAAAGGWVDAIMTSYDPKAVRDSAEFNKALDACHKAGVGLICMKEMRGVDDMPEILPEFEEMGLTPWQAVLHAVWSDERIASICSHLSNLVVVEENAAAARKFKKPMDKETVGAVIGLYERYASGYCSGCDGRCRRAGKTDAALNDITRALSYYERDGRRNDARNLYTSLTPEQQDWHGADLEAASAACLCKLDFASLLPRAEKKLA